MQLQQVYYVMPMEEYDPAIYIYNYTHNSVSMVFQHVPIRSYSQTYSEMNGGSKAMLSVTRVLWVSDLTLAPIIGPICYHSLSELIMLGHNYTNSLVETATAAVNAGTCLEDGNSHDKSRNAFQNIGDAVNQVNYQCLI